MYTKLDLDPANTSAVRYASNATGATFTLAQTTTGGVGLARIVSIVNDATTDHSGKTIAIVGTDADGKAQTETITGPGNAATVVSTKHFLTVTSVTPSATIGADTFDIGFNDDCVSKTVPLDYRSTFAAVVSANMSGTVAWDYEVTYDHPNRPAEFTWTDQATPIWVSTASLTADDPGTTLDLTAKAMRVRITSYTDTGELQVWVNQVLTPV